jgi:uncharacterized damage-inducible protein DinB
MIGLATIRECFHYNDWARDKVYSLAAGLSDTQLDQSFPIGPGSLRATLQHLYGSERTWLVRWQGTDLPELPHSRDTRALADLHRSHRALAATRDRLLAACRNQDLDQPVSYVTPEGQPYTNTLGDILLHVCNHGAHHRAQGLNMLRRLGRKPVGLDYLFMQCEQPTAPIPPDVQAKLTALGFLPAAAVRPSPALDLDTLRAYFRYGDWAQRRVLAVAADLPAAQLDQPFEMGLGTARRTLLHIRDGEQWWYENWTGPAPAEFPKLAETTSIAELAGRFDATAAARSAYLGSLRDTDLQRMVAANVAADLRLEFRLGETMLQLWGHGTHHRAQVLNMFRLLGAPIPRIDYIVMRRAPAADGASSSLT